MSRFAIRSDFKNCWLRPTVFRAKLSVIRRISKTITPIYVKCRGDVLITIYIGALRKDFSGIAFLRVNIDLGSGLDVCISRFPKKHKILDNCMLIFKITDLVI